MLDPTATPYRVYTRDERLQMVEITEYSTLSCDLRFNDVGSWSLDLPASAPGASALHDVGNLRGVVVVDEAGRTVFSGPSTRVRREGNGSDDTLEVSGTCDNGLLARRWARPVPSGPPYTAQVHDARSGLADQVIAEYVTVYCGAGAAAAGHPERTIPGLEVPGTSGVGTAVEATARFDNLLELIQGIAARGGGLLFRCRQRDVIAAALEFVVTKPVDKSATVTFDPETGSLSHRTHEEAAPAATYVVAAGGGEGTAQAFSERGDPAAIARYGLREAYVAATRTDLVAVLDQKIDEVLAQGRESIRVEVETIDTARLGYGVQYGLGDLVSTRAGDVETIGYVAAISLVVSRDRAADAGIGMIRPTIQTLGVIKTAAGLGIAGYGGGVGAWLARLSGSEPIGTVKLWAGTIAAIPIGWRLMDGTNGLADMRDRFLVGADADTGQPGDYPLLFAGGAASVALQHSHAPGDLTFAHNHEVPQHAHNAGTYAAQVDILSATPNETEGAPTGGDLVAADGHKHQVTGSAPVTGQSAIVAAVTTSGQANLVRTGATGTALTASTSILPPFRALYFVQRVSA